MKRKRIGFITANPEGIYARRIMRGIFAQCHQYGYDAVVFSPLVQVMHYFKEYLHGELNIYQLIQFDLLDGIIVDTNMISEDHVTDVKEQIIKLLAEQCKLPVVTVDLPLADYPIVKTDDVSAFSKITAHVIDKHHCRNIWFLTGFYGHEVSEKRLQGFTEELERREMKVDQNRIFYGDFWYTSGETLAERIISGDLEKPDAVICASDHMAIGLVNRLVKHGIRVPEDIIVTGFDATTESILNEINMATYEPETDITGAEAVNQIRKVIEPDAECIPAEHISNSGYICGESCGCKQSRQYFKQRFRDAMVHSYPNYNDTEAMQQMDFGQFNRSFMTESLTGTKSVSDMLYGILYHTYLLQPFRNFYLCLRENWLDSESVCKDGYPDTMRTVIHAVPGTNDSERMMQHCGDSPLYNFPTAQMLPELTEERPEPSVFYFTPVHFQDNTFGYAVLECSLIQENQINLVYHNWLRSVNLALEMKRSQNKLVEFAERDALTGMLNRLGMQHWINDQQPYADPKKQVLVSIVDIDKLKDINDHHGHSEGDFTVHAIASLVQNITLPNEICVRLGGDAFAVIGIDDYDEDAGAEKKAAFEKSLATLRKNTKKPYPISASIGCAAEGYSHGIITELLKRAEQNIQQDHASAAKKK
ncbi:MAG TPA: hypothetical protein DCG49_06005 [Ruminococcus sp.]|nr:hypothetical protein [Ruminococcus sp.]